LLPSEVTSAGLLWPAHSSSWSGLL
jgi:hypothetical protein